jgi:hypothetical protein
MDLILLRVKFEVGLPISVLNNAATSIQKLEFKTDEVQKKVSCVQTPPLPPTRFFRSRLSAQVHVRAFKMTRTCSKKYSHGDGSK